MGVIRQTKSVKAVMEVFENSDNALSSVELIEKFSGLMNKTTVYRILARLVDENFLHSFKSNDGVSFFARYSSESTKASSDLHPHFQCKKCGKTKCVPLDITLPSLPNYKIDSAEFLITGVCEHCN